MFYVVGTVNGEIRYWSGNQFVQNPNNTHAYKTERGAVGAARRLKRFPIHKDTVIDVWDQRSNIVRSIVVKSGFIYAAMPDFLDSDVYHGGGYTR